jgi:hypothetical protein
MNMMMPERVIIAPQGTQKLTKKRKLAKHMDYSELVELI